MAAELGLNVFQVIQNELLSREGTRSTLGIGFRLSIIEERLKNNEAKTKNGLVWKPRHALQPISALTPEARQASESQRKKLLERKGARPSRDDKDPTMLIRDDELWLVHRDFPRTVIKFKELQFHPEMVRSLLNFYDVMVYRPDGKLVLLDRTDNLMDVKLNLETCLEELATVWGIDWFRIGGLALPGSALPNPQPYQA